MILDDRLARGDVLFLDGGIGSEIERLGGKMHATAWCGVSNRTEADLVRHVHKSYLEAGVDIITTNTFATCRHVLEAAGLGDETVAINCEAVELAKQGIDAAGVDKPIAIAGSMSNHMPWLEGTVFADDSLAPTPAQESANYREWAHTLAEAGCDFLIMEMMMDTVNAIRCIEAAASTGLPVWVGMSTTRGPNGKMIAWDQASEDGETIPEDKKRHSTLPLDDIVAKVLEHNPQVVGIMHSSVKSIQMGLDVVRGRWDGPMMAYPEANGWDALAGSPLPVTPSDFADYCDSWVRSGTQVVGGCCGTTVNHIKAMTERLASAA